MNQPVSPINNFLAHVDPKTGRFTDAGFNYFSSLTAQVNSSATTIEALQAQIAALQKGQTP